MARQFENIETTPVEPAPSLPGAGSASAGVVSFLGEDMDYAEFLRQKEFSATGNGFDEAGLNDMLFPFQEHIARWALSLGRAAVFADCGTGKTFIELAWADAISSRTNGRVLVLAPIAVSFQNVREGVKMGIEVSPSRTGEKPLGRIVVTNYERLHYFDPSDFKGIVCDESGILKNFSGKTRRAVTEFMKKIPYRLLCTATAAPNDYIELGTSSEALGDMGFSDMLSVFFKKNESTMSRKDEHRAGVYRFRGHAEHHFWRWVCTWARAFRKPSDLGYQDDGFDLPPLTINDHVVTSRTPPEDMLFSLPAANLFEQRKELRRTLHERCERAASLINSHRNPAVAWCHLNDEGHLLSNLIPDAIEVSGSDHEDKKEEVFRGFADGDIRVVVSKPTIAGFGLNWQHCAHQTFFPSHSYEQFYQAIRRCWRYGQDREVVVDLISTEGQARVLENLKRKSKAADTMFTQMIAYMNEALGVEWDMEYRQEEEVPSWL